MGDPNADANANANAAIIYKFANMEVEVDPHVTRVGHIHINRIPQKATTIAPTKFLFK